MTAALSAVNCNYNKKSFEVFSDLWPTMNYNLKFSESFNIMMTGL